MLEGIDGIDIAFPSRSAQSSEDLRRRSRFLLLRGRVDRTLYEIGRCFLSVSRLILDTLNMPLYLSLTRLYASLERLIVNRSARGRITSVSRGILARENSGPWRSPGAKVGNVVFDPLIEICL